MASETVIYGISSILGRLMPFLLVPLYTDPNVFSQSQYGVQNQLFAISGFLLVLFGYGLETAYFRYALKHNDEQDVSYGTALSSITITTLLSGLLIFLFAQPIATFLGIGAYRYFLELVFFIVILDTLTSIPFAHLRAQHKAINFASLKLGGIALSIGLNLFFYLYCPFILKSGPSHVLYPFVQSFYRPEFGIGYAFVANIVEATFKLLFLLKDYFIYRGQWSLSLLQKMTKYGWPIMVISFAGMVNEVGDRQLLNWFLPGTPQQIETQIGIYGACYKLSIFLALFIQAFRYAGEPFFFAQSNQKDARMTYAIVLKFFTIVAALGFLSVALNINIFKQFITNPEYYVGLFIVPILLMAYVFSGMYYNLSIWYKLTDKTHYGLIVAVIGALVTIVVNVLLIPKYGYAASAWATLLCFLTMLLLSIGFGKKFYPVPYDWPSISFYILLALMLYFVFRQWSMQYAENSMAQISIQFLGVMTYLFTVILKERKSFLRLIRNS